MAARGDKSRLGRLKPGDVILFAGRSFFARVVNFFQALWAKDHQSMYNHVALVTSTDGDILHASRWFIRFASLRKRYRRSRVMIVRCREMTLERFRRGMAEVGPLEGRVFAFWRQALHAVRLGWLSRGTYVVCSELVARFLQAAGARRQDWAGINVRDLYDEFMEQPQRYQVLFRGRLMDYF